MTCGKYLEIEAHTVLGSGEGSYRLRGPMWSRGQSPESRVRISRVLLCSLETLRAGDLSTPSGKG